MNASKISGWKDALGSFFALLAVSLLRNLMWNSKESIGYTFGAAAIAALCMYFIKRTDLFDYRVETVHYCFLFIPLNPSMVKECRDSSARVCSAQLPR